MHPEGHVKEAQTNRVPEPWCRAAGRRATGCGAGILVAGIVLLTMVGRVHAQAAEEGVTPEAEPVKETVRPEASVYLGIFSQYVWRGIGLSNGKSVVIQPSATVEWYGASMNLWGNLDTDPPVVGGESSAWNEMDLTLAYARSFGPVEAGVSYIYYGLDGIPDSQEVSVAVGVDTLMHPRLNVYREVANYPGWYLNFGVSESIELVKQEHWGMSLDLGGSVGYQDVDGGGGYFNDLMISAGLAIPFYEYFCVTPMVAYTMYMSREAYDYLGAASVDGEPDHIFGGFTASLSF